MRLQSWAFLAIPLLALPSFAQAEVLASPIKRTLDPCISPDGSQIAFVWQSDVWLVSSEGGTAQRITVHGADELFPQWSKDGKHIIFASNRYGNLDVFRMEADGSNIQRLTWSSSNDYPCSVAPDGSVYGYSQAWGRLDVFMIPALGGDLIRMTPHPLEMEYYPDISPDGSKVVFNTAGSPSHWRKPGHNGSNTAEVWIADRANIPLSNMTQVTKNDRLDMFPRFLGNDQLVVAGNHDGAFHNLYTMGINGRNRKKITNFTEGTIRGLSTSNDGKIAYQKDSEIWVTDSKSGNTKKLEILAPTDSRRNPVSEISVSGISSGDFSPNKKKAVVQLRGDLFLLPANGGTTIQLTDNPAMDSNPQWIDDNTILYVAAGDGGHRSLKTLDVTNLTTTGAMPTPKNFYSETLDCMTPIVSPDHKWVAFHRGKTDLMVMPTSGGTAKKVATGDFFAAFFQAPSFSWSPDSEWLAVSRQRTRSLHVSLIKKDGSQDVLVAKVGKGASIPVFSPDGKHIIFGGTEGLDFSETRNSRTAPMIVDLVQQGISFSEDDINNIDTAAKPGEASNKVFIDERGIFDRKRDIGGTFGGAWPASRGNGYYANINGQLSYLNPATGSSSPVPGVAGSAQWIMDLGNVVYMVYRNQLYRLTQSGMAQVRYSATARVNMADEEMAIFEEAWWALDRLFYDEDMHGKDWDKIRRDFRELVPHAHNRKDFYDLMAEMVQLLDSSHQGSTSSENYRADDIDSTGWLGVEWNPALLARGTYSVSKVYAGSPADHSESRLEVGDVVVSINGKRLGAGTSLDELMRGTTGRKTIVEVRSGRIGTTKHIAMKPINGAAISGMSYTDWVEGNRRMTHELSNGKLGYIHIQGMNAPSLSTFLTEIATECEGKEGVLVDVRYNGGGYTSHIILNVMRKVPWLIRTNPDMPGVRFSENIYRGNSLELPSATLTNEYSFSNAEIFSEGIRQMKLGPIVGETTGAGVIGTFSYSLWDGGAIRMPASGAFTINGENLEGNGRKPDFEMPWNPNWGVANSDPQLAKAVEELLKKIR